MDRLGVFRICLGAFLIALGICGNSYLLEHSASREAYIFVAWIPLLAIVSGIINLLVPPLVWITKALGIDLKLVP